MDRLSAAIAQLDLSAQSILPPRIRLPSMPSMLFSFIAKICALVVHAM